MNNKSMKKLIIKLTIISIVIIAVFKLPLLNQTIDNNKIQFSIMDSIKTDIAEHQILTPSFIMDSIKEIHVN